MEQSEMVQLIENTISKELSKIKSDSKKQKDQDQLMTIRDAMEYLSCSAGTIHKYKRDGILKFRRIGRKVYFLKSDLDKKLAESVLE